MSRVSKRYVIYSKARGIYLGDTIGRDFFAQDEERGEWETAITFASEGLAKREAAARFPTMEVSVMPVDVDAGSLPKDLVEHVVLYATVEECAAAGLPEWDVCGGPEQGQGLAP